MIICLLLPLVMMNSCKTEKNEYPFTGYNLFLSIQDIWGNDLVEGIEYDPDRLPAWGPFVNRDLYQLEYVYPDPCMDVFELHKNSGAAIPDEYVPLLKVFGSLYDANFSEDYDFDDNDYTFLVFHVFSNTRKCDVAKKLTVKLKCPYVFGDNAVHEIVTYWEPVSKIVNKCYRIEFDGKTNTEIEYSQPGGISRATVILDND